jgi:hyperosmotically inducible periplasmic protein
MRALLIVILIALVGFLAYDLWTKGSVPALLVGSPTATSGTIDTATARERGAALGEKTAVAAEKVKDTVTEAGITTKIKAKMSLDDTIDARRIDVSTTGSVVTVSGTVPSQAAHDRALALARETNGVTRVVDRLRIEP